MSVENIIANLNREANRNSENLADPTVDIDSRFLNIERKLLEERLKKAKLENESLAGVNESNTQDREQRKEFAERIFSFVCYYMGFVAFVVLCCGIPCNFHLNDVILVTLLGTTTANILGVLYIVVRYLFSRDNKK